MIIPRSENIAMARREKMKNHQSFRTGVVAALFGALIFVVTAYIFHIPTPATGGYIHLGDAFVYLAASILPGPYAIAAAGIGEALSDALTGSIAYALPTFLIKAAMAMCFSSAGKTILSRRNSIACAAAGIICVAGYYVTEVILYRNFTSPLVEVPANAVQAAASAVVYLLLGKSLDRLHLKKSVASFTM
jgi:uncharacterized repeat protein (TIGR04002 family)